ncbi:MAG: hypothetical protein HKN73_18670 [Gemmatimonadetes bacterium]|nr:hypothetical protein [Gemmatimonadota bacterium]
MATTGILALLSGDVTEGAAQETGFRGWVSLLSDGRAGWLENENRIGDLCRDAEDLGACYGTHLAPAVDIYDLRPSPDSSAEVLGQIVVAAVPGRGLTSHYRPAGEGRAMAFTTDVYLKDWGYGPPFFHQTFLEERAGWYLLPADPWERPVWLDGNAPGLAELRISTGEIIELRGEGFLVLEATPRSLTMRPEQDADMWCQEGDPPPLRETAPRLMDWDELVDERGHLLIRPKYMKGC